MYTSNTGLIRNYIKPIIGKLKVNEVTSRSLEQYLNLLEHNNEDTGGLPDAEAAAARLSPLGGLRETGGLPLFSPEGRTYSPPVKQAVVFLRHRALSEGDCGCCGSLQTMPQHLWALLSSSAQTANSLRRAQRIGGRNSLPLLPSACANLPPAALPQRWTVRSHRPFSLLRKRNRKKETR